MDKATRNRLKRYKAKNGGNSLLPAVINPSNNSKQTTNLTLTKGNPKTADEALPLVNPLYRTSRSYQINCQRCAYAFELQQRGYNVEALPNLGLNDGHSKIPGILKNFGLNDSALNYVGRDTTKVFWEKGFTLSPTKTAKKIEETMKSWGNGSRGAIVLTRRSGSGHIANLTYENGKIAIYDSQVGKKYVGNAAVRDYIKNQRAEREFLRIFRTDDAPLDFSKAHELVKNI